MVGILVVTHGNFSEAIIGSMELVFGRQEKLEALTLNYGDDIKELLAKIKEKARKLDDGDGVKEEHIQCVTGLNLPMLITVLEERERAALWELPEVAMESGKSGIVNLKELIG